MYELLRLSRAFLRGESSAEEVSNEMVRNAKFVDLVLEKAAERRDLRIDQVRCSLAASNLDPTSVGSALDEEPQGLH
ncbi:hypothetical protein GMA8713_01076 [Grimontia marina]|uniref:Uncharacterized protein n=1 Tax=Grimontia marina TaxID=646534 RepID=A0A128EYL9_9GAMM|nr:hypothetical protein GMA8713_01076 [Grimontia marina]